MIYASNKVSYMHRCTVVQELVRKLYHKEEVILRCIDLLLEEKEIGFMKSARSSKGDEMLQVNKSKHNEMKSRLEEIVSKANERL